MCYAAPLYTIPPWSTLLFNNKPFSSLVLCLALFKLSPFCTNPFVSAKLFHMLLACPIYSTPTICSQQLLNEFFLPGNCSMPKSESHSLAQQLYRTTHRTNAENYSTLYRCLHSNYMSSYYPWISMVTWVEQQCGILIKYDLLAWLLPLQSVLAAC